MQIENVTVTSLTDANDGTVGVVETLVIEMQLASVCKVDNPKLAYFAEERARIPGQGVQG